MLIYESCVAFDNLIVVLQEGVAPGESSNMVPRPSEGERIIDKNDSLNLDMEGGTRSKKTTSTPTILIKSLFMQQTSQENLISCPLKMTPRTRISPLPYSPSCPTDVCVDHLLSILSVFCWS